MRKGDRKDSVKATLPSSGEARTVQNLVSMKKEMSLSSAECILYLCAD